MKPKGLTHHSRNFATIKVPHWVIIEQQEAFPDLGEKMRTDPDNATNIYSAFIAIVILKVRNRLTPDAKTKILQEYKVI